MSTSPISKPSCSGEAQGSQEAMTEVSVPTVPADAALTGLELDAKLKSILADVLGLEAEDADALDHDSGLFGHLPELDSMAVAGLLTEMEDRLDIIIEDDDVDGEMLETYGGLLEFAQRKLSEG